MRPENHLDLDRRAHQVMLIFLANRGLPSYLP